METVYRKNTTGEIFPKKFVTHKRLGYYSINQPGFLEYEVPFDSLEQIVRHKRILIHRRTQEVLPQVTSEDTRRYYFEDFRSLPNEEVLIQHLLCTYSQEVVYKWHDWIIPKSLLEDDRETYSFSFCPLGSRLWPKIPKSAVTKMTRPSQYFRNLERRVFASSQVIEKRASYMIFETDGKIIEKPLTWAEKLPVFDPHNHVIYRLNDVIVPRQDIQFTTDGYLIKGRFYFTYEVSSWTFPLDTLDKYQAIGHIATLLSDLKINAPARKTDSGVAFQIKVDQVLIVDKDEITEIPSFTVIHRPLNVTTKALCKLLNYTQTLSDSIEVSENQWDRYQKRLELEKQFPWVTDQIIDQYENSPEKIKEHCRTLILARIPGATDLEIRRLISKNSFEVGLRDLFLEKIKECYSWVTAKLIDECIKQTLEETRLSVLEYGQQYLQSKFPDLTLEEGERVLAASIGLSQAENYIRRVRKAARMKHPYNKLSPDLFESDVESVTFYNATGAPDHWEDLYGETYQSRDHVYAFGTSYRPDAIEFYSSEELISSFLSAENFINPRSRENTTFPKETIDKLALLSKDSVLGALIRELQMSQKDVIRSMRALSTKDGFKECLKEVLEIAMIMRGWSGTGSYPLNSKETRGEVNHVELSQRLSNLEGRLEKEWSNFKEIRLIKQSETGFTFNERTLWAHLQVVIEGKKVDACIRMTSGHFARTVWFYLNTFFHETPFVLSELESVS